MSELNLSNQGLDEIPENTPEVIEGDFVFSYNNVTTLKNMPKKVNGNVHCQVNPGQFREAAIRAVCEVSGFVNTGASVITPAWMLPKVAAAIAVEPTAKKKK
jgi:hypothetical protein